MNKIQIGERVRIKEGKDLSRSLNPSGIIEVEIIEILEQDPNLAYGGKFRGYEKTTATNYVYHINEIIEEVDFNPSRR